MGMRRRFMYLASMLVWSSLALSCAGLDHQPNDKVLSPPVYVDSATAKAMKEGNRFFTKQWWRDAEKQYLIAIQSMPTLAEAHYNLGLVLYKQARFKEAHIHFKRALTLEPRSPVYRQAPPFRRYGDVTAEPRHESDPYGHNH